MGTDTMGLGARVTRFVILAAIAAATAIVGTEVQAATPAQQAAFDAWIKGFRVDAAAAGISAKTLDAALTGLAPIDRIIERDLHQAEFKLTFQTYFDRVATPKNIDRGRALRAKHDDLLRKVAARYRVQPRFIMAIWAIESRYGQVRGTMPVVPALATLAFDARRSKFFSKQLLAALRMIDAGHIELPRMKGSWAGAMGQPQFIPTSYLAYAQDFDGDGRRDIWSSQADVFASIANYLASSGWSDDQTWGRPVRLPDDFEKHRGDLVRTKKSGCRAIDQMSKSMPLSKWQAMGVRRADGRDLPTRDLPASLVRPDGAEGPSFLVYRNYQSILRYNCAHLYALTVSQLADRIAGR